MKTAILSANVFTGDSEKPWAEALAMEDGVFKCVGTNEEIKAACGEDYTFIEMPGRLVVPGLVDAHTHFLKFGRSFKQVFLQNMPSIAACREEIKKAVKESKPGEWIVGIGWNNHDWEENREPSKEDLDDITPDNPVLLYRMCIHSIWVNSLALKYAGINSESKDPAGGRFERDPETGEPTGLIRETPEPVEVCVPEPDNEALRAAAVAAQQEAFRLGLTGVHSLESLREWDIWKTLDEEGNLKIRIHHTIPPEELEKAKEKGMKCGLGSERLWFGGVKMFTDGSLGSGTAHMFEEYSDEPGNKGIEFTPKDKLIEDTIAAYRHGCHVAIHAIGDKAVSTALDVYEAARKEYPGERRDRIEHAQVFIKEDLARFKNMGIVASVQPVHLTTDWAVAERRWGAERCTRAYAYKTMMNAGVQVQFGSDAPVESIDPVLGLRAAVTRQDCEGGPEGGWRPEERYSLEESIKAFTSMPAWCSGKEDVVGTVSPGKWADLTIFEKDLFETAPAEWNSVEVEMTIIGGEIVYRKN